MTSLRLTGRIVLLGVALLLWVPLLSDASAQEVVPRTAPADIQVYQESIFPELTGNQLLDSLAVHYRAQQILSYDDARDEMFTFTDNVNGVLECAYTGDLLEVPVDEDNPRDITNANGWNTEHVWPQSRGAGVGLARNDLHHLRALRADVNTSRSNYPFVFIEEADVQLWWKDDVSQAALPAGNLSEWSRRGDAEFQVRDSQQGDIARMMFYFYLTYPEEAESVVENYFADQAEVLRSYHNQDEIDATEVQRNIRTEMVQGNLNPFIVDTTLVRRAFFEDFDPDAPWGPEGYFVDFEDGSKGSYAEGSVELAGKEWSFNNALIAGASGDSFIGRHSARLRHQQDNPAIISMSEDKSGGLGTVSFLYAPSSFGGDRSPDLPAFVVEYSTDGGASWQQAGSSVQLADTDEFSTFSHTLQLDEDARIRIRSISGSDGRRFNIEDFQITNYSSISLPELAALQVSDVRFTGFGARSEVLDNGGSEITSRGFVAGPYGENGDPSLGDEGVVQINGSTSHPSIFEAVFSSLEPGKTYLARAYATNSSGTAYSGTQQISLSDTSIFQEMLRDGNAPENWTAIDISFETAAGGYARLDSPGAVLTTPVFDASAFSSVETRFDVAKWGGGGDGPIDVHYSLDSGTTWNFAGSSGIPEDADYLEGEQVMIEHVSETMKLRFSRENSPSRKRLRNVLVMGAGEVFTAEIGAQPEQQNEGFRLLSAPMPTTLGELLDPLWTQGSIGADAPHGPPSVFIYDGADYTPAENLNKTINPGDGVLVYVFEKDDYEDESSRNWPKVLQVSGQETDTKVVPELQATTAESYNLIGNPLSSPVSFEGMERNGIQNKVFVYDASFTGPFSAGDGQESGGGWRSWNGTTGSLEKGHIAPFQSFFIRVEEGLENAPSFEIPTSARVSSGDLYDVPDRPEAALRIAGRINGRQVGDLWLSFGESTSSGSDVSLLYPLEAKPFLALFTRHNGKALNIRQLPFADGQPLELPLSVEAWQPDAREGAYVPMSGNVELIWPEEQLSSLPSEWDIELYDHEKNERIDLRKQNSYSFSLSQSHDAGMQLANARLTEAPAMKPVEMDKHDSEARFMLYVSPPATSSDEQTGLPHRLSLHQNYPNPFNPGTRIDYELPESGNVRLDVFNVQGQRVATLVDKQQTAGHHSSYFDASGLASGVYVYRLTLGNISEVRRMTLIR